MTGKQALEEIKNRMVQNCDYADYHNEFDVVEQDLNVLDVFKNSLTIKHTNFDVAVDHDDSGDVIGAHAQALYEITQNEIDKQVSKKLREWVLQNAFPKELKALEIIKDKNVWFWVFRRTHNVDEYNEKVNSYYAECAELTQEEYGIVKDVLTQK